MARVTRMNPFGKIAETINKAVKDEEEELKRKKRPQKGLRLNKFIEKRPKK